MSVSPSARSARSETSTADARAPAEPMTMEQALEIAGWPASLANEAYQPWIVDDVRVR